MECETTLLLTSPDAKLLAKLALRRPDWKVVELRSGVHVPSLRGQVLAYIDWICPEQSGLEICRRLREADITRSAHLTMVLENADPDACRRALQAGADDYLVGPLDAETLLQRGERHHGRQDTPAHKRLVHGDLTVDLDAHQVRFRKALVPLRPSEFHLLVHFLENPDQLFSRTAIIDRLGKHDLEIDERTVDVWIGRLRRALKAKGAPDPLRTVRTLGYVLDSAEDFSISAAQAARDRQNP